MTTNSPPKLKRKRGDRKVNQYPDKACYVITEVRPAGEILEPMEFRGQFCNTIGALVRDQLNPTILSWKDVLVKKKGELWDKKLKLNFRFPEGKYDVRSKWLEGVNILFKNLQVSLNNHVSIKDG
jgi:hypothetical protein